MGIPSVRGEARASFIYLHQLLRAAVTCSETIHSAKSPFLENGVAFIQIEDSLAVAWQLGPTSAHHIPLFPRSFAPTCATAHAIDRAH
jgi:hypothetical protein